ncbi:hypothetical protein B9057_12545 [Aestuarium zhoushanense]|nr:hypothetical protein B9057_12545 [Aestuarium zhoushanense]
MRTPALTKTRLFEGVWEGVLTVSTQTAPSIVVTHLAREISGVDVTGAEGGWVVRVPVPADVLSDGVQTFIIADRDSGETLATFSVICGEPVAEDIRAELDLLRAELDLLKKAFRRHCVETM